MHLYMETKPHGRLVVSMSTARVRQVALLVFDFLTMRRHYICILSVSSEIHVLFIDLSNTRILFKHMQWTLLRIKILIYCNTASFNEKK